MISFVYFDVGGVLLDDFSGNDKWAVMKRDLGVKKEDDEAFSKLFKKYEQEELCLSLDVDTLIPIFTKKFGIHFPQGYSMLRDFTNRFVKNKTIWPIVKKVKESGRIGLLTNMYPRMFDAITNADLFPPVTFDVIIDSSVEKCKKPDRAIFELAQKRAGVDNDEIFYIDNSMKNIQGAKDFGWKTFFYDSSDHEGSCRELSAIFT